MQVTTNGNKSKKVRIGNDTYMLSETQYFTESRDMYLTFIRGSYNWVNSEKNRGKKESMVVNLSNEKLENLRKDSDELISKFASDIVSATKNQNRFPSWYLKEYTEENLKRELGEAKESKKKGIKAIHKQKKDKKHERRVQKRFLRRNNAKCKKLEKELSKEEKKVSKRGCSQKKKVKLIEKIERNENSLKIYKKLFDEDSEHIRNLNGDIKGTKEKIKWLKKETKTLRNEKKKELSHAKNAKYRELPYQKGHVFESLKYIDIKKYNGVVGCYIVRNRENGRCYVGQSKDVGKRIKQHFDGTKPRNYIFADDYYGAINRDNLFEISVVRCHVDELNVTEKYLISYYDAKRSGYNKTSGGS